jgi:hypothetical protein
MNRNAKKNDAGTLDGLYRKSLLGAVVDAALDRAGDAQGRIRALAYAIWEDRVRSGEPGDEVSDWLTAEWIAAGPRRQRRR